MRHNRASKPLTPYATEAERAAIVAAASKEGMTVSRYMVTASLDRAKHTTTSKVPVPKQNLELYGELRGTTSNLNQLVYHLNSNQKVEGKAALAVATDARNILRQVLDFLIKPEKEGD